MSSKQVLWYPSVFLMVLLTGQTHSLGFDGHKDSAESLKWYTLKCYQGRTPYRSSKSELHPQLFVAKSHIYENVSRAALFIPQFKGFVNARAADIICTSKRLADTTPLTKIACPFESGSQRGIMAFWKFVPLKMASNLSAVEIPARRSLLNYLNIENLNASDEGLYTCQAISERRQWVEIWTVTKDDQQERSWTFRWTNQDDDVKVYRIRDSRRVTALPFARSTWLEEKLESAENSDYI